MNPRSPFRSPLAMCLASLLGLQFGCDRVPERELDYTAASARISGTWRLVEDDDLFHGRTSCFSTLLLEMDSPSESTAYISFCPGEAPELSRRLAVEVVLDPVHGRSFEDVSPQCRLTWERATDGSALEVWLQWAAVTYTEHADRPAFYAEDVLYVDFVGRWFPGEPTGAHLVYARDPATPTTR